MRRAGYEVWLSYDLDGSYEETPPTLLEELSRDRRWCQGNLQHLRLFLLKGIIPAHRFLFLKWRDDIRIGVALVLLHIHEFPPGPVGCLD